jgi:hypothetical protein
MTPSAALRTDNRRAIRMDVRFQAALREFGTAHKFSVDIIDLSVIGFRCETSFTLLLGQQVFLTIPTLGGLEATVVRRNAYVYGCEFEWPLHDAVFNHIVTRHRRV